MYKASFICSTLLQESVNPVDNQNSCWCLNDFYSARFQSCSVVYMCSTCIANYQWLLATPSEGRKSPNAFAFPSQCLLTNDIHFWFNEKKYHLKGFNISWHCSHRSWDCGVLTLRGRGCNYCGHVVWYTFRKSGDQVFPSYCSKAWGSLPLPGFHFAPRNHAGISCGLRSFTALYVIFICLPGIYPTQQLYYTSNIFLPHESIFLCFHLIYLKTIYSLTIPACQTPLQT